MPSHIVVNNLGLTYKSTIGVSIATIPDVCKTPSPGGPIPLPYPNFANQGTLRNGTTTVFAKGGKMIAIKGSQYGMSTGDEPGTVGGVKSNTFKQATDWILYSFDVKMDGKNACRHTDKKFHNNKNTVDLAGNLDPAVAAAGIAKLQEIVCKCDRKINREQKKKRRKDNCRSVGEQKHQCCNQEIAKHNDSGEEPKMQPERCYNERSGRPDDSVSREWPPGMEAKDYFKSISGKIFPDAALLNNDGESVNRFVEFKFQCPKGTPTGKGKGGKRRKPSEGTAKQGWTPAKRNKKGKIVKPDQRTRTVKLGKKQKPKVRYAPVLITNEAC